MTAITGQTLFDIAIKFCGSATSAIEIAILNGIELTEELSSGTLLTLPEVVSKGVVQLYQQNSITPATAIEPEAIVEGVGVGYYAIEIDNIIG